MLAIVSKTDVQLSGNGTPLMNSDKELEVYIVGPEDVSVYNMFHQRGYTVWTDEDITEDVMEGLAFAVFTGGADVSPELYGEENISSYCNKARDDLEINKWKELTEKEIPMVGICRGGQFLNVMNGGKLIQHVNGHSMGYQKIFSLDGKELLSVHEDHHQAIVPTEMSEVIARAKDGIVEVCFYHKTKTLCFQPHPEWGDSETEDYFFLLLEEKGFV